MSLYVINRQLSDEEAEMILAYPHRYSAATIQLASDWLEL